MSRQELRQEETEREYILQLLQGMNGISWLYGGLHPEMVDIYLIDAGIDSALDIHFDTVPEHNAFRRVGPRFAEGIVEDLLMRFQAVGAFRGDHLPEIAAQPG